MLNKKNLSPQRLAAVTALLLALIIAAGSLLLRRELLSFIGTFVLTFLLAYGSFLYTLQQFIYRKIKLVYKFIYQTKATKREEFFYKNVLPQKTIEEVSEDVEQWAIQKSDEIESLQRNEKFRKEFLLNLAHELKTPVFAVQGYVHTLMDGAVNDPKVNKLFLQNAAK